MSCRFGIAAHTSAQLLSHLTLGLLSVCMYLETTFSVVQTTNKFSYAFPPLPSFSSSLFFPLSKLFKVWSLQTNSVLTNLQGHEGWIKSLTGTKSTLYSGSHDETIRVWDLNSLQCKHTLKAKDKVEALLATPQALFSASGDYLEVIFFLLFLYLYQCN